MVLATNLGFPRIGAKRELKKAVEAFWKGNSSEAELQQTAKDLRQKHWEWQRDAGLAHIPSNDFSFYDQVLDTIALVGAVPERYGFKGGQVSLETYFAMARGMQRDGVDVTAMEMTKWFDTNYHYIVPEFSREQEFALSTNKPIDEFNEAKALGVTTRPVVLGPVSFLLQGKVKDEGINAVDLLPKLLPVYGELLNKLADAGAEWVQLDEPCLGKDLSELERKAFERAYAILCQESNVKILLASYFEDYGQNQDTALSLPVDAIHYDAVRGENLDAFLQAVGSEKIVSVGAIDGRNIWKSNLEAALAKVTKAVDALGQDRVWVAGSCSLLHSPVDLNSEQKLDDELKNWLAFAVQKLDEIALLANAASGNKDEAAFKANADAIAARAGSSRIHNPEVKQRVADITDIMTMRKSPYADRAVEQRANLGLPALPTTTIGSFPQTQEVRQARAKHKKGELSDAEYKTFLEEETERAIRIQEEIGIDVLVHGEFERNDMVEYFGEQLSGFAFTQFGWVQSYGSRCVKPPIIFGDVSRPTPMTVDWATFSQSKTQTLMKGMLTGPVTILQWSFVRDDQPRSETCKQIALAIRDEVNDLEAAGIKVIQIDEAAFREGLPIRLSKRPDYLKWAVDSFRICSCGVRDETQIHTHMCYSEFNDMIESIADMDADVISIETSRSQMELLDAFVEFKYPNEIGPGVYDIHSPRVPTQDEMEDLLHKALRVLAPEQVWVNPDCGLKTRGWDEVKPALRRMVEAAESVRQEIKDKEAA